MGKVKITKEQENAFKSFCDIVDDNYLETFITVMDGGKWVDYFKSLNEITPQEFSLLLNGWYEVEKKFKVGDWVYESSLGNYYKICKEYDELIQEESQSKF